LLACGCELVVQPSDSITTSDVRAPIVAIDGPAVPVRSTVTPGVRPPAGLPLPRYRSDVPRPLTWSGCSAWGRSGGIGGRRLLLAIFGPAGWRAGWCRAGGLDSRATRSTAGDSSPRPDPPRCLAVAAHAPALRPSPASSRPMERTGRGSWPKAADIGTAVFPDADLKVFLTASVQERARAARPGSGAAGFPPVSLLGTGGQFAETRPS